MKTKEQKIKDFEAKYPTGKQCPVCGKHSHLEEFRFTSESSYLSQCVDCNKLVSSISAIMRKLKTDGDYCERRIHEMKTQIKIHELIYNHQCATAFDVVKLIKGSLSLQDFYTKVDE